ncbi:MAG: CHY zinc finger protein [Pseudoclavibacter sp.]
MTAPRIHGSVVDDETRCIHYRSPLDVVAIKFRCCGLYFPCLHCHDEAQDHPIAPWGADERGERAVLCGKCASELTITEYTAATVCPRCAAPFNPGCALHFDVYFTPAEAR